MFIFNTNMKTYYLKYLLFKEFLKNDLHPHFKLKYKTKQSSLGGFFLSNQPNNAFFYKLVPQIHNDKQYMFIASIEKMTIFGKQVIVLWQLIQNSN